MISQWEPSIREIPAEGSNPFSGPLRIGSRNYAGIFIRGDVAFGLAANLRLCANNCTDEHAKNDLIQLADQLCECLEK